MGMDKSSIAFPLTSGALMAVAMYLYKGELCSDCWITIGVTVVGLFFFREWSNGGFYKGKEKITGKTVIITGANTGIGKETAIDLANRGGRIFLACRDAKKGEAAVADIIAASGNLNVFYKKLDLSSFESIREFAKDFDEKEDRLDILINNAGVMSCPKMLTKDGIEMQLGVNHLGHFLLTNLLMNKLKKAAPSRIIILSSMAYSMGTINFDDINSEKSYGRNVAYQQSKLANVLHAVELTNRLKGTGVTANSVHPGVVDTELARYAITGVLRVLVTPLYCLFVKTPLQGAQTTIRLAVDPALETVSGQYFKDCKEQKTAARGRDEAVAKRLWEVSEKMTNSKYP